MLSKVTSKLKSFLKPKDSAIKHCVKGMLLLSSKKYNGAIKEFTISISINPSFDEPYIGRSDCYSDLKKFDLMLKDLDKALFINPINIEAHTERGNYFLSINDKKAISDFTFAINLYERGEDNSFTSRLLKQKFKGKELIEKMRENNKKYAIQAYLKRGILMLIAGEEEYDTAYIKSAIGDFDKVLEIDHNNITAYDGKASCYGTLGKTDLALDCFNKAISLTSSPIDKSLAMNGLARLLLQLKKTDDALIILENAIKLNPNYYALYLHRGICHLILNKKEKAIRDFEKCLELRPDCEEARENLENIHKSKRK